MVLEEVNRGRNRSNEIHVGERSWSDIDLSAIDTAYTSLFQTMGTDRGILRRSEIGTLQTKIGELLSGHAEGLRKAVHKTL